MNYGAANRKVPSILAGKLLGFTIRELNNIQNISSIPDHFFDFSLIGLCNFQRKYNVLACSHKQIERIALENYYNVALLGFVLCRANIVEQGLAVSLELTTRQYAQACRLAATQRPNQNNEFPQTKF